MRKAITIAALLAVCLAPGYNRLQAQEAPGQEQAVSALSRGYVEGLAIQVMMGYQPSMMNLVPYNLSGTQENPKPSGMSLDLGFKYKWYFLYGRTGIGYAFSNPFNGRVRCRLYLHCIPGEDGRVPSQTPVDYSASYFKMPILAGFNFNLQDEGSIEFGLGLIYASGSQEYIFDDKKNNVTLSGSGWGLLFQLAFEVYITKHMVFTVELNMAQNRTGALQFDDEKKKNLTHELDFSGPEFLIGAGYYF